MEPDINNMTLNEYLMYEGKHRELEKGHTSRISVAPKRNIILVYPDFNEEDEDHNEVDIDNMTLEEYARYELAMSSKKSKLDNPTLGFTSQFFNQSQHTPNPPLDKEDSSLNEILDDLFRIGAKNIRKMEYEVSNRCDDETVDITDYEDSDQDDGEIPNYPAFSVTNVFASVCEQVDENIDISKPKEKKEVQVEDVVMDEYYDIDHLNTEETL
ncbi:hypothetical protein Tco_1215456 [Tanacetum coccineum]